MIAFTGSAAWGAFVLCSMIGWGIIVTKGLLRNAQHIGWAQKAVIGLAWTACIGGLFDLAATISTPVIVVYLSVGALAALYSASHSPDNRLWRRPNAAWDWRVGLLGIIIAAMLGIRVAGSVIVVQPPTGGMQPGSFHTFDDFQAYMVYPLKMVETGSMRDDPFSLRRTPTHALGGGAFLQSLIVAVLPAQSLRLLDVAIGTILVVGLLWFYMARLRLPRPTALLVIVVFLAIPPPLLNITSLVIPAALFISLFMLVAATEEETPAVGRAAVVGMHIGAICVLKTNLIPAAAAFLCGHWALQLLRSPSKHQAFEEGLTWIGATTAAMVPWMLDADRWAGTFIPRGAHAYFAHPTIAAGFTAVGTWPFRLRQLESLPPAPYMYVALLAAILFFTRARLRVPLAVWSLVIAAGLGTLGVINALGGAVNNIQRFMYPFLASALLVSLVHTTAAFHFAGITNSRRLILGTTVAGATAVLLLSTARSSLRLYWFSACTAARAIRGEQLVPSALATKYRNLQGAVPPGTTILERMEHPYLFDFRRNRILIDDIPGTAALKPGMPFFAGSEPLATYLLAHDVRYVAFDYASEAGTPRKGTLAALAMTNTHPWGHAIASLLFDFQDNLKELGRTRKRLFDDGRSFVVDLQQRVDVVASTTTLSAR